MKKLVKQLAAAAASVMIMAVAAPAQELDLSILPADAQEIVQDRLDTRFPPELKSIKLNPAAPVGGQPTSITVEIYNDAKKTSDETSEVYVLYMANFEMDWKSVKLSSSNGKTWTGQLPAFQSGDEVVYSVRAMDSSGNIFIQVPCMVDAENEVMTKEYFSEDCVNAGDLKSCESFLPRGCMMQMALNDSPDQNLPAFGRLYDLRIGYDEGFVYVDMVAGAKIEGGSMTPTDLRIYGSLMVNPDVMGGDTSMDAMLKAGGLFAYSPLLKQFESTGYISDCFFGYQRAGAWAVDTKNTTCISKTNHLIMKTKWSRIESIGANPSGVLQFIPLGVQVTLLDMGAMKFDGRPMDVARWTAAQFTEDTYFEVK
jgi:hypothetical protein